MRENKLFVEGELDALLLFPILKSGWTVVPNKGAGKRSLPLIVNWVREDTKNPNHLFLRDRDFDFDPDMSAGPHKIDDIGYRWKRHEIENYMVDPSVVCKATGLDRKQYENALIDAGSRIYYYEAARWAVGIVRRGLPPFYVLETHPSNIDPDKYALPDNPDYEWCKTWAEQNAQDHKIKIGDSLISSKVIDAFEKKVTLFSSDDFMTIDNILLWFSGKDLLAGLRQWLQTKGLGEPGKFRTSLRDWMTSNPKEVLANLTEWRNFVELLP